MMTKFNKTVFTVTVLFPLIFSISGCKKALEVDYPIDNLTAKEVFSRTNTASLAVTGIYNELSNNSAYGGDAFVRNLGLLADELKPESGTDQVYSNSITTSSGNLDAFWLSAYSLIYRCNSAIEGLLNSTTIPEKPREILLGEVKFVRAYLYFNLINLYGDVPLVTTTDYTVNRNMPRMKKEILCQQIIRDLSEAQLSLTESYLDVDLLTATQDRIRPNKFVATALLAKMHLYLGHWQEAETEASKLLINPAFKLVPLNEVFLRNSKEAIWQLQPSPARDNGNQKNTLLGTFFIPFFNEQGYDLPSLRMSDFLLNAFEIDDRRRFYWVNDIRTKSGEIVAIPFKYRVGSNTNDPSLSQEYTIVFRLSEQYLIRAEARAMQGKLVGSGSAKEDLDAVRSRAGLIGTTATGSVEGMLNAIDHERYVELFIESGDRWFNLKRRFTIDDRMVDVCITKGGIWQPYKALIPIPADEFVKNPAFPGHQNPGYAER